MQEVIDEVDELDETLEVIEAGTVVKIRRVTYYNNTGIDQCFFDRFGEPRWAEPGETIQYEVEVRPDLFE